MITIQPKKPVLAPVCTPDEIREVVGPVVERCATYLDGMELSFRESPEALWLDVTIGSHTASCSWSCMSRAPGDEQAIRRAVFSAVRRAVDAACAIERPE